LRICYDPARSRDSCKAMTVTLRDLTGASLYAKTLEARRA
jgi:hypothetical protein